MRLSTQTDALVSRFGEKKAISILAQAGFDALDYSMFSHADDHPLYQKDGLSHADLIFSWARQAGLKFNQAHAPFPTLIEGEDAYNQKVFGQVIRSIEVAGRLGARQIIVHPTSFADQSRNKAENLKIYGRLLPHAQKAGVKIALENMWGRDDQENIVKNVCSDATDFCDLLDALDRQHFTACLDLGHCGLVGEDAAAMIRKLGQSRLQALHVHDNDHRNDSHTLPFSGAMDWQAITLALADIDYQGDMTLESDQFLAAMPDDFLPQAVGFMQETGRQLMRMIEAKKV